jgi:predicted LPLAT superfamily acyltransferase
MEAQHREQVIHQWATRYAAAPESLLPPSPQQWFNFYPFWKTDDDANP